MNKRLSVPDDSPDPPVKNITVRSEAGPDRTTIRMAEPEQSYLGSVVVFGHGETRASVLEGFTLTGGRGSGGALGWWLGGGVFLESSSPTLVDCTITGNSVLEGEGGGVMCEDSSPLLMNCRITGNSGSAGGGVAASGASSPTLMNCTIARNATHSGHGGQGGGMYGELGGLRTRGRVRRERERRRVLGGFLSDLDELHRNEQRSAGVCRG